MTRPFAPPVDIALGFRALNSVMLAGLDETKLHFRHQAQHRQHHFPHGAIGRNCGFENTQICPLLVELMDEIEDIAR